MSWGTNYRHCGYLSRIAINEIPGKREECEGINGLLWREILAYAAMTPPAYAKDDEGNEYPWAKFIAARIDEIRNEIAENERLIARLDDCSEALADNPGNVTEG